MNQQVAIVTGASRGIGAATATLLADNGYAVCVNYLNNPSQANDVVEAIQAAGGKAIAVKADLANEQDIINLFSTVDRELGPVTALVNNGGISGGRVEVESLTYEFLENTFKTNVFGTFICCREAIKRMKDTGGSIVNISSQAGQFGGFAMSPYASSKASINTLSVGLAREVAKYNIRVNAVSPAVIHTDAHKDASEERLAHLNNAIPMGRMGEPLEVAEVILWLLSDKASYISGSVIPVTGAK